MTQVAICLAILAFVVVMARLGDRSWTSPAVFFAVLWWGYSTTALLFITDIDPIAPALVWVAGACAVTCVGSWASLGFEPRRRPSGAVLPQDVSSRVKLPHLLLITGALASLAVAEILFVFKRAGFSFEGLTTFAILAQVSSANRTSYGYGDLQQGLVERVLFTCTYAGPLFGGVLFRLGSGRAVRLLAVSTLLLAAVVATLYGSRMGVLFGGSFWIASYMATQAVLTSRNSRSEASFLARMVAVAGTIIIGLSVVAMIVRYSANADRSSSLAWLLGDAFGFFAAFATWFTNGGWQSADHLYGYRTFMRFFQVAGISYEWPPPVELGFTNSNIYTVFRGLIEDFGIVGALCALAGIGFTGGLAFRRARAGRVRWIAVLTIVYAFILISFSFSIFTYTTPTVALLMFVSYFALAVPRKLTQGESSLQGRSSTIVTQETLHG